MAVGPGVMAVAYANRVGRFGRRLDDACDGPGVSDWQWCGLIIPDRGSAQRDARWEQNKQRMCERVIVTTQTDLIFVVA